VPPIKGVANAQPLTAAPVTEADVRRWTRDELAAQRAAAAPKKIAPVVDDPADGDDNSGQAPPAAPPIVTPSNGNVVAPAKSPPTSAIPF